MNFPIKLKWILTLMIVFIAWFCVQMGIFVTHQLADDRLKGITVTSGAVAEPFLEGIPHPDTVFRSLLEGANAGDAMLRGTAWLKWMIVNLGDPAF